jgi:hypothetical protein
VKIIHENEKKQTNKKLSTGNKALRDRSIQRAKDLSELGIEIDLFPLQKSGTIFNHNLFYHEILTVAEDEDSGKTNNKHMCNSSFVLFICLLRVCVFLPNKPTQIASMKLEKAAGNFEELRRQVKRKEYKKRSLHSLSIKIGQQIELSVRV